MYNDNFLRELMLQRHRTVYARITSLLLDETPLEFIEGRITSGSVNVDGTSAVRRTCSLSMVTDTVDISDYLWGLNTKFKLEVGLENNINKDYPNIIWFKQGIFIITSFSTALSVNNCTINLQGKDKMCLLNGENGGSLPSQVDFGKYEEVDVKGNTRKIPYPLKDIVYEAVHHYGGEPFHNIIINDLDNRGLELQEYRYDTPLYLIRKAGTNSYIQGTLNGQHKVYPEGSDESRPIEQLDFDSLIGTDFAGTYEEGENFYLDKDREELYQAAEIKYGQTIGYTATEMTYNGELVANIGESVTSVLDKIKNMLGNFEYFYDLDGRFIFQEQKNYLNTSWSPLVETSDGLVFVDSGAEKIQFTFEDSSILTAFNNTPNLANLKNDYSVWGTRKGAGGKELKIHMRYAIDAKPIQYTTIEVFDEELWAYNNKYGLNLRGQSPITYVADNVSEPTFDGQAIHCDWRELIYQMAIDYRKYNHLDDFELRVARENPIYYPSGKTGYEHFYVDMEGFWRQLYNYGDDLYIRVYVLNEDDWGKDDNDNLYFVKDSFGKYISATGDYKDAVNSNTAYYKKSTEFGEEGNGGWTKKVNTAPEELNFWFDLMDTQGELSQFAISKVGNRPKVSNDKDVKAIYYRQTPEIIFTSSEEGLSSQYYPGYTRFNLSPNFKSMFSQSTQGKSAKDAVDSLLYNHAYCIESVSITSVPIYCLEPNQRIYIKDNESGIVGEYIPTKFTIPLTYNGTMSITATKAVDRII